ncbi:MAG: formate C-acetyltransferase [Clostridiales bacterium]|nr:formate C-acetyltransferase [Clostridiales bacterium]
MAWNGFVKGNWCESIDVQNFIAVNRTPYVGDQSFLEASTARTDRLMAYFNALKKEEAKRGGVLDIDTERVSSLLSYPKGVMAGYDEIIFGLQTDQPLKRGVNPFGGIRMARQACEAYGYQLSDTVEEHFKYKTTHNEGVFRVYSDEIKAMRKAGVITGLPDAYGRGRVIGDYRRIALYGVDYLIEQKRIDKKRIADGPMLQHTIQLSEELYKQIDFLKKLKAMAAEYGHDIGKPAVDTVEAVQWTYYGYLAGIKEQNGAAMSLGRVSTFIDIYAERDMAEGRYDEKAIQEIIDDFVIKLRMARQLRTPDYNELFAGDPLWVTEAIGGMGLDGKTLVTKTSFRFLHTLTNLGPAPEPNMTVLWSNDLPEGFKKYCAELSILTDAIQYENDDLMRPLYGDDYGIACCVSAMKIGKDMQFFGARSNLPKTFSIALNGGYDTMTAMQIGPAMQVMDDEVLDFDKVWARLDSYLEWLCDKYVNTMNIIHFMHDKYAYEKTQMALHDTEVHRYMAFGIAGLSVLTDSLSAIKYASVKPIKNAQGYITDYEVTGDFPKYGNDLDEVDSIAVALTDSFIEKLKKHETYRQAEHTVSILTITSNVVYGIKTDNTPDGRRKGMPFAPGANPMHGRDKNGALASLNSVAKLSFDSCRDGISCTFSITPHTLGTVIDTQSENLVNIMDGYFGQQAHHLNVNVLNREKLVDAMENPDKYPNLTIRVSGYAVNFNQLSRRQQEEVIQRTYHEQL